MMTREVNVALRPMSAGYETSLVSWTHLIYALHAFSLLTGIITTATVVGAFLTGWPSLIAVVLNYVRRNEVRGTWLESHFRWQLRTFWWAFGWMVLAFIVFGPLVLIFIGYPLLVLSTLAVGLWAAWRIGRGWMALRDGRPMA